MKFDGVKKVDEGRFISRYDLYYTTEDERKRSTRLSAETRI